MAQTTATGHLRSSSPVIAQAAKRGFSGLLLAVPLLVYLIFPTRNYYWDGVGISLDIEKRLPPHLLLYPSHLIYALWGAWLYRFASALGIHARALFVLQTANSILAGLSIILMYKIVRQAGALRSWSAAAALVLGFSATWWKFATDANAYIPSICLVLCACVLLESRRWAAAAGLAHAAAMLFHELAIVFLPVAILRLRRDRRAMAAYLATSLTPVAAAYWLGYSSVFEQRGPSGFLAWLTLHSPDSGFSFYVGSDLMLTLRGTLRLFFGGKLAELPTGLLFKVALGLLAITVAAFLFCLWRARSQVKFQPPPPALIVWVSGYAAFLFFWMPQNTFYRLYYLPPLIALLTIPVTATLDIRRAGQFLAASLFLWNFTFFIYPQSRVESNTPLRFALAQSDGWPRGTAILFHDFGPDLWTISYFNPQVAWIGLERPDIAQLEHDLKYARDQHQALWLEASAYDLLASNPIGRSWLARHEQPAELIRVREGKYEFRFHCAR